MAQFDDFGLDEIEAELLYHSEKSKRLIPKMLEAGAAIMAKAQREKGAQYGVRDTGKTLNSINPFPVSDNGTSMSVKVAPQGSHGDGVRNAYIAFVNEYGAARKAIIPRPFLSDAKAENMEKVREEMLRIWEDE